MHTLKIATFGYHEVTDQPWDSGFQRPLAVAYKHTTERFREHLDAIDGSHLTPQLVTEVDFHRPGQHLLLTFDDGGKSALYIGDQLCRRGWRGHFLITTGLIGARTFLDRQEIIHIRGQGHLVGSHSHTHPDIFRSLTWDRMVSEWRKSCDILAQLLGEPCVAASVPGGDVSEPVLKSADAAGLRYLFTSEPVLQPGCVGGCRLLGRFCVKASVPATRIAGFAALRGWKQALAARRCSVMARTALYPIYAMYVRRRTRPIGA